MRSLRRTFRAVSLAALATAPGVASSQALTNITSVYVAYTTRENTANPTGELKARIDSVDRDLAIAIRTGQTSQSRRLLAQGITLLANRPWTDAADFNASAKGFPLIIALHGLGATEDSFFDSYGKVLPLLAEQHGYIVAGELGYRVDGGYGWGVGTPPADPPARRASEWSEMDVMHVLANVKTL